MTFQNYYHLKAKLSCIVADIYYDDYDIDVANDGGGGNNEILLAELVSEPIIVRGRNPSFYAERNDILIKGRSASSKSSFKIAGQSSELKFRAAADAEEDKDDGFVVEHEDEPEDEDDHHNHSEGDVAGQEDQLPHTQNGTGESPISSGDDDEKTIHKYHHYHIRPTSWLLMSSLSTNTNITPSTAYITSHR